MYTKLSKLNQDKIEILNNLSATVDYRNKNIRIGANGIQNKSIYVYSKWFDWHRDQRKLYKNCFDESLINNAMIGWFLKFPEKTGFLDLITYWVDNRLAATVASFALEDQEIILNGEKVAVYKGEGIKFSLKIAHEIKPNSKEMRWACLMLLK
jgi:hypothetical protein